MMYNFYPRPPRGGRRSCLMISGVAKAISIHALREEGDDLAVNPKAQNRIFLSTPSARRATDDPCPWYCARSDFYPRPPRGGRPVRCCRPACSHHHFYPRPPRGGRQTAVSTAVKGLIFLSTPSARRATDEHAHGMTTGKISIHALREEGDTTHEEGTSDETHFYPRPPRGGRHNSFTQNALQADISIHALREEGDR